MAEFKLGRLRFVWKGAWVTATSYVKDDVIRYGGKSYVCLVGHTAAANFYTDFDTTKWSLMTSGQNWAGQWTTSTFYNEGDIARYGGKTYICIDGHTADPDFYTDFDASKWQLFSDGIQWKTTPWAVETLYKEGDIVRYGGQTFICLNGHTSNSEVAGGFYTDLSNLNWQKFTEGQEWKGNWTSTTYYKVNDLVKNSGIIYICVTGHTSQTTLEANQGNWQLYTEAFTWKSIWTTGTYYRVNDIVKYGGNTYTCNFAHTSDGSATNGLEADQSRWTLLTSSFDFKGTWDTGVRYKLNDVVKYGANLWINLVGSHTSSGTFNTGIFSIFVGGLEFEDSWSVITPYQIGDIVTYGGYSYVALQNNVGQTPSTAASFWEVLTTGFKLQSDWSNLTSYKIGDVIRYGGYSYVAASDNNNQNPDNNTSFWTALAKGFAWEGLWNSGTVYKLGDSVAYGPNSYVCVEQHTADLSSRPDNDLTGIYWNSLIQGAATNVLTTRGDLVYYAPTGNARLPVGADGQVLKVNSLGDPSWGFWGVHEKVYYVAPAGFDTLGYGDSLDKPFKTVKYACQQVVAPCTIFIKSGTFEEVLPIVVPADVALVGDELRSTVIQAAGSLLSSADAPYTLAALTRIQTLISDVIQNISVTKTPTNTKTQDIAVSPAGSSTAGAAGAALLGTAKSYIDFHINAVGVAPAMSGTNTASLITGFVQAALVLQANKEFLAEEATAFITATYPSYSYSVATYKKNIREYVDALAYDLIYTGNYKTLIAAQSYRYTIQGSTTNDMFYVRNGSGIRNMTLRGLSGTLGAVNSYGTRRPSAGSYVSLDPGFGISDTNAHITNKSPYVQNVTTFGTACVGLKIDGNLHTLGNKSIVANDFTQILSDGIGVWCTNLARTELVSVFSYYAHIAYLAETGGKIRATNGNNSYGTYGSVAEGVDPTETPKIATVNNKSLPASIGSVLTNQNQILWLEYNNAGQSYATTIASVTVAGTGGQLSVTPGSYAIGQLISVTGTLTGDATGIVPGTYYVMTGGDDTTTIRITDTSSNALAGISTLTTGGTTTTGLTFSVAVVYAFSGSGIGAVVASPNIVNGGVTEIRVVDGGAGFVSVTNNAQSGSPTSFTLSAADTASTNQYVGMRILVLDGLGVGQYAAVGAFNGGTKVLTPLRETTESSVTGTSVTNNRVITISTNGFSANQQVMFLGTSEGGVTTSTLYFVKTIYAPNEFSVSLTSGGDEVVLSTSTPSSLRVAAVGWDVAVTGTPVASVQDSTSRYIIEPRVTFASASGSGALARCIVVGGIINRFRIIHPGSGYATAPTMTITDPSNSADGTYTVRIADGVLDQPNWSNRGTTYSAASATVQGVGFSEILQVGPFMNVSQMTAPPKPGANVVFSSNPTQVYKLVTVTNLLQPITGIYTATLKLSPPLTVTTVPAHGTSVTIREKYSQVRLTGHDFLDIGTGNFEDTNYPGNPVNLPAQENEILESNGGRCFYTSTDQDGNFRVGELFKVEQATGTATLNADNFNLSGLNELALGSVALGGTGAVIREFSTDGTFLANSDNIVPTQKAIRTFITSLLGAGGSNLTANSLTAGTVFISGNTITTQFNTNLIVTAEAGSKVILPTTTDISGSTNVVTGGNLTVNSGGTLTVNGTGQISTPPSTGTDITNKNYVDRALTLNTMWTSAW
jgi:hypothetical protein